MPIRPTSAGKKSANKKTDSPPTKKIKKTSSKDEQEENLVDPHKEEIERLTREREDIRTKFNTLCTKIFDNIDLENYQNNIDFKKQQPSDMPMEHLLTMIDEICYYRTAFLNLYQEIDDNEHIPVQRKITQLSIDDPELFRRPLTSDQRLTFVIRERDLWKENAQLLQMMYATVVDQLEMGIYRKLNIKASEILRAHRLNLEDVCLIFSSPILQSINDAPKLREKRPFPKEADQYNNQHQKNLDNENPIQNEITNNENLNESKEQPQQQAPNTPSKIKRNVSFADEVNVFYENNQPTNTQPEIKTESPPKERTPPIRSQLLPSAHEISVDKMDSNLRMSIVKELSKDSYIERPVSRMSSTYGRYNRNANTPEYQQSRTRKKSPEWVELARLIGIDESEIDHWLSQSLQYPASRVLSTWCNSTSPSPTVAELHSLLSSKQLNRFDLAQQIETMYNI